MIDKNFKIVFWEEMKQLNVLSTKDDDFLYKFIFDFGDIKDIHQLRDFLEACVSDLNVFIKVNNK